MERLFTVDEADAMLPLLRDVLAQLQSARAALEVEVRSAGSRAASNGSGPASGHSVAERQFQELVARIESLGVVVRDPESGLVDFAATRDGEPIYLCWRLGEDRVAHWHPRDTGFAGRQPL